MIDSSVIREHMDVISSDGKHVGRVDHVKGMQIELTRLDLQAMGRHHLAPLTWVNYVDNQVHLSLDKAEVERRWSDVN